MCPTSEVTIRDTSYIERIDTIYRVSTWDSILIASSINPLKLIDTIVIEDKYWKGQFIVSQNDFKAKISHLNDSIAQIVKSIEKASNNSEIKTVEVIKEINKPIRDKWYFRFMFGFIITWLLILVVLVGWVYMQYQKGKIKWLMLKR